MYVHICIYIHLYIRIYICLYNAVSSYANTLKTSCDFHINSLTLFLILLILIFISFHSYSGH